ncbi:MAG TPA: hypothetical protein VGQ93_07840 [Lysobacter sp.]|nr:hypothetical protein [Lysobacter sp.]
MFARHSFDARRTEYVRLVVCMAGLLVTSGTWHASRPGLIRRAAESSVGCSVRGKLMAAALRANYAEVPADDELWSPSAGPRLWTHSLPRPGWVAWRSVRRISERADGVTVWESITHIADERLREQGSLRGIEPEWPPVDADGDGQWEVFCESFGVPLDSLKQRDVRRWAVIRLGVASNQVAWVGLVDGNAWSSRRARLKPIWRDEDGDGVPELVFVTLVINLKPPRTITLQAPQTVAVFAWDHRGGVLGERTPAADQSVIAWDPPLAPVEVPIGADMQRILEELLRVPEDFGWAPNTQPASLPADNADQG